MKHYGKAFGPLFWDYDLKAAGRFYDAAGEHHGERWDLRWYGLSIFGTEYGIGIIRREKRPLEAIGEERKDGAS